MHFIASSVLSFFLSPFNWILLLIILSFFVKSTQAKKNYRLSALFVFLLFGNGCLLNSYAHMWQPAPVDIHTAKSYSCGVVLGGFAAPDENGEGYFTEASDRFIQAVKCYKLGKIHHIIISGGNGKSIDNKFQEATWTKEQMEIMGVPDSVILCEDKSDNTADNALNTKHLLDSMRLQPPYLLITSAFHIPRATLIFKTAGVSTVPFPCNYMAGNQKFSWRQLLPSSQALSNWEPYLKETAGYLFYLLKEKLSAHKKD
jgi:uncharacterized SAM-binding protein YcdF (DUF218 family)